MKSEIAVELLDVKAAAAMLGVSARTIWRLRDAGRMPLPLKIAGAVRWRRRELLDWLDCGAPDFARARRCGKGGGR